MGVVREYKPLSSLLDATRIINEPLASEDVAKLVESSAFAVMQPLPSPVRSSTPSTAQLALLPTFDPER
jgi:hypothetical protein